MNSTSSNAEKANGTPASTPAPDAQRPPLFYGRPLPLSAQYHAAVKIRPPTDFAFAAKTNVIPLTIPEFVVAARNYPIIFIGDDLIPSAAVGLASADNLFVDVKGLWEFGQYIPAYARRYPFILLSNNDAEEKMQVGIDDDARSTKDGAQPLFKDGTGTDAVKEGLDLCEQFHAAYRFGIDFLAALKASDIMEPRTLEIELPNSEKSPVGSFMAVNEEKFNKLPDETFLEWRKKGWLHAIYFHLQSMNNWDALMARASSRLAAAQAVR